MMAAMLTRFVPVGMLVLLCACGSSEVQTLGADGGSGSDSGNSRDGAIGVDVGPWPEPDAGIQQPERHRSTAETCDNERVTLPVNVPEPNPGPPFVNCTAHSDCTDGANGRCLEGRGGWDCSYDGCFSDDDCNFTCLCEGGFRGDYNICLSSGGCNVDADCGAGNYCSPTYGSCGNYAGTVAYYCHTAEDECINDSDCGGGSFYCAFDLVVGRWSCKDEHCAG